MNQMNEISLLLGNALILLDTVPTSGRNNLDRLLSAMQQIDKARKKIMEMKEDGENKNQDK